MADHSKKKRPRDVNALAKDIVDDATDNKPTEDSLPEPSADDKEPKAVEAGRLGDLKGRKARAKKLTPNERRKIAKKAADARWKKSSSE
jgi:hypothetical protein